VACLNAKPLPGLDETRDVRYVNQSYTKTEVSLTLNWYFFGPNRQFPNICPGPGSCAAIAPYCTNDSKKSLNFKYSFTYKISY
jgi:hypothetical protein